MIEMAILPMATPSAMIMLFISVCSAGLEPKPLAVALEQHRPVILDHVRAGRQRHRRAQRIVTWSWVEATKVIHTGKKTISTPSRTTTWLRKVRKGRFSTISNAPAAR